MAVVLDSGALIQATNLRAIGAEYFTVEQVVAEVRDKRARQVLKDNADSIRVLEPTELDLQYAIDFSKKTGDYTSLSGTDLKVIALAVRLEKERNGGLVLRAEPPPVTQVSQVTQVSEGSHTVIEAPDEFAENLSEAARVEDEEGREETTQSDDEGWITPQNYHKAANTASEWTDPTTRVMTSDFPVQNVVLQMGLKLVAIDGRTLKHVKRWVLKCQGCRSVIHDTTKEFCPTCGNHALVKISCYVNSDGNVTYSGGPRRPYLRGTVFSIPTYKGGKDIKNIILREDELTMMGGRQYSWQNKKKHNPYDADAAEWAGVTLKSSTSARFGPTRRNPNEPLKKQGKRKRR